jgi:hypothetical protein
MTMAKAARFTTAILASKAIFVNEVLGRAPLASDFLRLDFHEKTWHNREKIERNFTTGNDGTR